MNQKLKKEILKANQSIWNEQKAYKIAKKGLYEVWYTMVDDIEREEAYWIRYSLLCPKKKLKRAEGQSEQEYLDSLGGDGMLWFGYFNARDPSKNYMIKKAYPLSSVKGSTIEAEKHTIIEILDAELTINGLKGGFETKSGKKVTWDLNFSHFMEPYIATPNIAKTLGFTNTMAKGAHPNLRISGKLTRNGETVDIDHVPGIQYHTYGDGYKVPWEWLSCHTFKDTPDAYLDVGYKVNKGVVEFFNGEESVSTWNDKVIKKLKVMRKIKRNRSPGNFEFNLDINNLQMEGKITAPAEALLAVEYLGPLGNRFYCYNSEIANCDLIIRKNDEEGNQISHKKFTAKNSVSFETVYDKPQEGIPYLPWNKEEL